MGNLQPILKEKDVAAILTGAGETRNQIEFFFMFTNMVVMTSHTNQEYTCKLKFGGYSVYFSFYEEQSA